MSRPFKFLFIIYGFFQSFGIIGSLIGTSFMLMRSGIGAMMSGRDFWIGVATAGGIGVAVTGLFFTLTVALISPPSANRALPVRIYLTIIWLLGGLLSFGWVVQSGDADRMQAWLYPTCGVLMFALLVTISNADQLSQRVRKTIPTSRLKRMFAFLFFNGAAGGLLWMGFLLLVTLVATKIVARMFNGTASEEHLKWLPTTLEYAFAYALTALLIHRKFLAKRPPKIAGLLTILLAGAWAIVPSIVLFFINQLSWKSLEGMQLGNIFNVFSLRDDGQRLAHQLFACAWLVLMILLNLKWFFRQVKNFQPSAPTSPDHAPPVLK